VKYDLDKTIERTLPIYWASYLVNGDSSGMNEDELYDCDTFLTELNESIDADFAECIDIIGDQYFASRNDANNLGGDVCIYLFALYNRAGD
jgi:hypothetical protein